MGNITLDTTGSLENYAETGKVFKIVKTNQYINFQTPVFLDTLKVILISKGLNEELVLNTDYDVPDEFIHNCDNDLSRAKIIASDFNRTLTSGIRMIRGLDNDSGYTVAISYQRLYPSQLRTAYYQGKTFNVTPELMYDLVQTVEQLKIQTSTVADASSLTTKSVVYELDESESKTANLVKDEEHYVDVSAGRFVIHPKGGSFYDGSVVVAYNGTKLEEGTDYVIRGMNVAKTKATSSTHAVMDFIILKSMIVGMVNISYHAYGGDPTIDNYRDLILSINNVINYLNNTNNLTSENLGATDVITAIFERCDKLEQKMRRLEGTPNYGDITDGKVINMKLTSPETGLHWFTIAKLYKTLGTNVTPCTADTFTFRIQTKETHIQFKAAVSVDLNNNEGDRLNVDVINENYPRGYVPFQDYSEIEKIMRPQIRVVWVNDNAYSGAYLQLGLDLTNVNVETISIEDMSGHESSWLLVDEVAEVTTPQDSDMIMPDGTSVWSDSLSTSFSESQLIPFRKGHLIWAGSQPLNRPNDGWTTFAVSDELFLEQTTNIRKFTKLRLDLEEQDGLQYPIDIPFNSGTEHLKGHASFTYQNEPVYINAEIYRENGKITVRINSEVLAGIESNELDVKDMVIYS